MFTFFLKPLLASPPYLFSLFDQYLLLACARYPLRLPVVATCFCEPVALSAADFSARWTALATSPTDDPACPREQVIYESTNRQWGELGFLLALVQLASLSSFEGACYWAGFERSDYTFSLACFFSLLVLLSAARALEKSQVYRCFLYARLLPP